MFSARELFFFSHILSCQLIRISEPCRCSYLLWDRAEAKISCPLAGREICSAACKNWVYMTRYTFQLLMKKRKKWNHEDKDFKRVRMHSLLLLRKLGLHNGDIVFDLIVQGCQLWKHVSQPLRESMCFRIKCTLNLHLRIKDHVKQLASAICQVSAGGCGVGWASTSVQ